VKKTADPVVVAAVLLVLLAAVLLWPRGRPAYHGIRASWTRTPGVRNPAVTPATIRQTICVRGWTRTVRPPTSYTSSLKERQMPEYGETGSPHSYQEDHLISLELGGDPTDPRNLWPEPYPRAKEVDAIENDLNAKVCSGELSLGEAQRRESQLKHEEG
jgi:hypothetical protein